MGQSSSLDIQVVLVPVDGSDEADRAAAFAVAVADRYDAAVHALYVIGEGAVRAIEEGLVDEDRIAAESRAALDAVESIAASHEVPTESSMAYGFSTQSKLRHPGSVVLDAADQVAADFIVIPREPLRGEPGEVLEKAAEYVLLYASQPVLSV